MSSKLYNNIYYFGVGSLHNDESSVDGGKYIRLPLMTEMLDAGYSVSWIGFNRDGHVDNKYLQLLKLQSKDYLVDMRGYVPNLGRIIMNAEQTSIDVNIAEALIDKSPGVLFIELRPNIDKPGYNFVNEWNVQTQLIELFYAHNLPVFVWDQDVWADNMPHHLRKKVVLLRSYMVPLDDSFPMQEEYLYGWRDHWFEKTLDVLKGTKLFDACYCGNVYGRRDEFLEYFKPFSDQNKAVCVQGNWLRKKYDDRDFALDNFSNFMFFGRTPHWSTLPSIALSKSVIQFSNADQQRVGLPTARIFEALMGHSVVFCSSQIKNIDRIVPEILIVDSGADLIERWNNIDHQDDWQGVRSDFVNKLKTRDFSYETRVRQLTEFIEKYYG